MTTPLFNPHTLARIAAFASLWATLSATPAGAQRRPNLPKLPPPNAAPTAAANPPAAPEPTPTANAEAAEGERQITPQATTETGASKARPAARRADCEEVRRNAKYGVYFDKVDIEKLVQTVSDATCRTFILGENIRGKISIIGPENGQVQVTSDQFYAAFLAALDANSLAVYPYGRFLKIVEKQKAKQNPIPTVLPGEEYSTNEQMVTKIYRLKYTDVEQLRGVLQQLVTQGGDAIPFQPDTLIVNDLGSNMHRLDQIVDQLDTRPSSDEVRVVQLKYAPAQEMADKISKLFESKNGKQNRNGTPAVPGTPPPAGGDTGGGSAGPATLSQLIPDERTNKLVVVASPAAMERINALLREIDIPVSGEGRINVYYLENANAEELASTLQNLAQGTTNRTRGGAQGQPAPGGNPPPGGGNRPATAAELFSGEVKISADKSTNSLVVIASQSDYRSLTRVIEKLDIPRRQVFIEAVIMEVNLDRNSALGVNMHGGVPLKSGAGTLPLLLGTNYKGSGLPPSTSITGLAGLGGFLAGLQGPLTTIPGLNLQISQFGVLLNALQESSDVNVLSTPHLLTSDNEEAEITVGQNVPFQSGFNPSNVGASLGAGLGAGTTGASALGLGLGGLGSLYAPITRQNVELKLTVKPQINESDYIRLNIAEQTEEIASQDAVLGPTTSKRSAKTVVVARNQETVVLGGIMQERTIESVKKIPVLGDIPVLGHLFRDQTRRKVKTNLLLFLTPYIVKDPNDFRRIFERKMKERQQFVEQFYGQVSGYEVAVDFDRKAGPLARMRAAMVRERSKAENGGGGFNGEKIIRPEDENATGTEAPGTQTNTPPLSPDGTDAVPVNPTTPKASSAPAIPAPSETPSNIPIQGVAPKGRSPQSESPSGGATVAPDGTLVTPSTPAAPANDSREVIPSTPSSETSAPPASDTVPVVPQGTGPTDNSSVVPLDPGLPLPSSANSTPAAGNTDPANAGAPTP